MRKQRNMKVTLTLVFLGFFTAAVEADFGFILMTNLWKNESVEVCSAFNPMYEPYPSKLNSSSQGFPVLDLYPDSGCDSPQSPNLYQGKVLMVKRYENCSFAQRGKIVQDAQGKGVIIVSDSGLDTPGADNASDYNEINVTVSIITRESYAKFTSMLEEFGSDNVFVHFYALNDPYWNINQLFMWILAVTTVAVGSLLRTWHNERLNRIKIKAKALAEEEQKCQQETGSPQENTPLISKPKVKKNKRLWFGAVIVLMLLTLPIILILLMYFFYQHVVYVIIALFCFTSCFATFDILCDTFRIMTCFTMFHKNTTNESATRLPPPSACIPLFMFCAALSVFWAVQRNESYAWILLDILGFIVCVEVIKIMSMPNFKISTIVLTCSLLFDVFFVFITPLLTANKDSIMVTVATGNGGKSDEQVPELFQLPELGFSPFKKCGLIAFSALGFADVIIPGLHVGFCAMYDGALSRTGARKHPYFIAGIIGYGIGLVMAFVSMYLMAMPQPALLYLNPCCFISTLTVSLIRKELKLVWNGKVMGVKKAVVSRKSTGADKAITSQPPEIDRIPDS